MQSSSRPTQGGHFRHAGHGLRRPAPAKKQQPRLPVLDPPVHDAEYLRRSFDHDNQTGVPLKASVQDQPKNALSNFCQVVSPDMKPQYETSKGQVITENGSRMTLFRAKVSVALDPPINGYGDGSSPKVAETNAALHLCQQLHLMGILHNPPRQASSTALESVTLSDGSSVNVERSRAFMDYYCRRYNFAAPDITFNEQRKGWEAIMTVGARRIGIGQGTNKKQAQANCYLDVTQYLESCDPTVWSAFVEAEKKGGAVGMAPKVFFNMSDRLDDEIRDLLNAIKSSSLYKNRPATAPMGTQEVPSMAAPQRGPRYIPPDVLTNKSQQLKERLDAYRTNPDLAKMREVRSSLPVYTQHDQVLEHIQNNDVTILMAATGSGKTTQIPQLILDSFIDQGQGAQCNVLCTQPRRLAAISVADRVAKERGERLGQSIGYQVRFEHKFPEEHGSVTFCTTGVFLKKMQTALQNSSREMDLVTHIVVDEVHERDVDTDLLLVVLKRLMTDRKARGIPLKVVLMSATIDPTLFQEYLPDANGQPAKVISIPGRSFPVEKHFMDDYLPQLASPATKWVFNEENVQKYIVKELGETALRDLNVMPSPKALSPSDDLELPYPLIALTISHVLQRTNDGHVLVFLPGWDEIMAVQRAIQSPLGPLGLNLNDTSKYSVHLLHSTIPLAEQQVIFEPPREGVRRIILSTNIAETSVTIPDVVYVIDTGKIKEQRYDPDRHMSSLVSAWVGSSNLNQRAGRAGRHRPGEYFGILGHNRASKLSPYQTVEMKRVDLSNVVMHVKALNFPGMTIEEVLAATIEPPASDRVAAAITELQRVGALDQANGLTSLGRVLLQLPIDPQMGRLVLFGSFFRCLDHALTLAAILTNRDPFLSPMHLKNEAAEVKASWSPQEFRSDPLATLRAYNTWSALMAEGRNGEANRFCIDNFLAKPTLFMIQKIRHHILLALYRAGVIAVSGGGVSTDGDNMKMVPPELNTNKDSLPLLAALITIASQPKFAIRTGSKTLRTDQDKTVFIHPSSVNSRKRAIVLDSESQLEKQLFAFMEKRQNISMAGSADSASTYIVNTTRVDPMTYMLFGAYKMQVTQKGVDCDDWLPITGNLDALDDIERLKTLMEGCMLRVFEGITMNNTRQMRSRIPVLRREEENESGDEDDENDTRDYSLSSQEVKELDLLTRDVVRILNKYAEERIASQSRAGSRPVTPFGSPRWSNSGGFRSGYSTPQGTLTPFGSRPGTPSRLSRP